MRTMLINLLVILSAGVLATPESTAFDRSGQLADRFEQKFRTQVNEREYPAAAFAIVTRDEVVRLVAMGHTDASRETPVDTDTVFRLASVSKTFAAETVALLAGEGLLGWEDPVTAYVPSLHIKGDASRIRLRHLLEHSSGIVPHAYDNLIEDGLSNERIMAKLGELDYICAPGDCYGYQNFIFSLVEPAAERVTSTPYPILVEQRIFKPLGMANASVGYEDLVNNPNYARPHVRSRGRWKTVPVLPHYYRVAPAAGVNASISDVAKWVRAQLGSHPEVIPPQMVEEISQPRLRTRREMYRKYWKEILTDAHYGMGWRVYQLGDERIVYHSGWVRGYRADVAFSPQMNLGMALLLNVEGNSISEMSSGFWAMALEMTEVEGAGLLVGP